MANRNAPIGHSHVARALCETGQKRAGLAGSSRAKASPHLACVARVAGESQNARSMDGPNRVLPPARVHAPLCPQAESSILFGGKGSGAAACRRAVASLDRSTPDGREKLGNRAP